MTGGKHWRWYLLGAALVVSVGLILGLASFVRSAADPRAASNDVTPVVFAAVSPDVLSSTDVHLTLPHGTSSEAAGQAAGAAASKYMGAAVVEEHFAHCVVPNVSPAVDQDCWAISLDPSDFHSHPPMGEPMPATYLIVLVDPTTDQILDAQAGNS